jgi:hypothetical protein
MQADASAASCGPPSMPFADYLIDHDKITLSEARHFTPKVEALVRGDSSLLVGADLNFMLLNYPNHHRALVATMRLGEKEQTKQPAGVLYSVACYFIRALRFRPYDVAATMLYANYWRGTGVSTMRAQLRESALRAGDDPLSHYNIGLVYLEMKDYDLALEQAHKAYGSASVAASSATACRAPEGSRSPQLPKLRKARPHLPVWPHLRIGSRNARSGEFSSR